ncbi:hypothetical protein [Rhizobium rhizogenes]|uniref:hypothetical protein n=1 Tax=Rhizobium rhizogenes TaxID=359 RepID=UPI00157452C1|nr:hypothetical protein [Rhizobium rhizogenes]NTI27129.1 hypothetical protein [Rhizobium rhizogenes]
MDNQIKFRVTVWQPYFAGCMLAVPRESATEYDLLSGDFELQREVFTWPLQEDVWAGIANDELRTTLHRGFTENFQATRPPSERGMDMLEKFVADVRDAIKSGSSEWSTAESGTAELSRTSLMINALSAFHNQLNWMLDMFRDLPGASVSVR